MLVEYRGIPSFFSDLFQRVVAGGVPFCGGKRFEVGGIPYIRSCRCAKALASVRLPTSSFAKMLVM